MALKALPLAGMIAYLVVWQPTPIEQLAIVCAVILGSGWLFYRYTIDRVREIVNGDGQADRDDPHHATH